MAGVSSPKVTVLVATYNHESCVAAALDSALAQQVSFPIEILVGDDGSTDGTRAVIREYERRYPDIVRGVFPAVRMGHGGEALWLHCLQLARGEYIACLDGDDVWTAPDKLAVQAAFLDLHPTTLLCFHNVRVRRDTDAADQDTTLFEGEQPEFWSIEQLLRRGSQTSSQMLRGPAAPWLERLRQIGPGLAHDWVTAVLARKDGEVGFINRVMSTYRLHAHASWSAAPQVPRLDAAIGQYAALAGCLGPHYEEVIRQEMARRALEAARQCEALGRFSEAASFLERCLARRPQRLDVHVPGYEAQGDALWAEVEARLARYRRPWRARAVRYVTMVLDVGALAGDGVAWGVRQRRRLASSGVAGVVLAQPAVVRERGAWPGLGTVTLAWRAVGTDCVELRVEHRDGPLVSRGGRVGSTLTGNWVHDRMTFVLCDASVTPRAVLDRIVVRVQPAAPTWRTRVTAAAHNLALRPRQRWARVLERRHLDGDSR